MFQLTNAVPVGGGPTTGSIRLVAGGTITLLTATTPPPPAHTPPYPTDPALGVTAVDGNITLTAGVTPGVNADVVLNNVVTTTGTGKIDITANRDVTGNAAGTITTATGNITITADADNSGAAGDRGTIQLNADINTTGGVAPGTGVITFSLSDCDGYITANVVEASNVRKFGVGALRLNGPVAAPHNITYSGTTNIYAGTLVINGWLNQDTAAVNVNPTGGTGGILGGIGIIGTTPNARDITVYTGGTLDPGDCDTGGSGSTCTPLPGQLTANGDVTFNVGSTFRVQLNGLPIGPGTGPDPVGAVHNAVGYDQLVVNGIVTIVNTGGFPYLDCSVGFSMPVGAKFPIIYNDPVDLIDTRFQHVDPATSVPLQEGDFFTCDGQLLNISYYSGAAAPLNDVTLTHPGRYDFNANVTPTQQWYEGMGLNPYYQPLYAGNLPGNNAPGWESLVMTVGRGGSEGDSLRRDAYTPVPFLQDLAFTGTSATFTVDTVAVDTITGLPITYQVVITSGDYGFEHNGSQFTVDGGLPASVPVTQTATVATGLAQFKQIVLRDIAVKEVTLGSLLGRIRTTMAYVGGLSGWTAVINGMEIRPMTSVGKILFTWEDAVRPVVPPAPPPSLSADGLWADNYYGWDATPNSVITVTTTNGTVLAQTPGGTSTADLDSYLDGVQVLSDANGSFRFQIQRPSGTNGGSSTITAWEIGGRSYGTVDQAYDQNYTTGPSQTPIAWRRFDFNNSSSPTATGYLPVLPTSTFISTPGYGWASPVTAVDKLQSPDSLRRDFHWAQSATFQVEVTPGTGNYNLRALFGEPTNDVVDPSGLLGGSGAYFAEGTTGDAVNPGVSPTMISIFVDGTLVVAPFAKPLDNVFYVQDFSVPTDGTGTMDITITAAGGVNPYFALDGLAIWQGALTSPPGPPTNNPQLLDPGVPTDAAQGTVLTSAALGPLVAEAIVRWQASGLTAGQVATLRAMAFGVTNLPGQELASTDMADHVILVDQQAAGRGWFIDLTPWEDSEYVQGQSPPGVDLLTVVMHEMGHALGYQDLDNSQFPQALMALQLMPEQARRAPTGPLVTGTNPVQPHDVNGDGNVTPLDVLQLINQINASGGPLTPVESGSSPMYYDVSGDNVLSAVDALCVVNYLDTPSVAQASAPVLDSPGSTGPLVVAPQIVPSAPAGSSPTTAGTTAPAADAFVSSAAGPETPVPVPPAAEGEDWLADLAADVHAASPDELAVDAIFQELGTL